MPSVHAAGVGGDVCAGADQRGTASDAGNAQDTAMTAYHRRQLMVNALALALHFSGEEAVAPVCFGQSKLFNPQLTPSAAPPATP